MQPRHWLVAPIVAAVLVCGTLPGTSARADAVGDLTITCPAPAFVGATAATVPGVSGAVGCAIDFPGGRLISAGNAVEIQLALANDASALTLTSAGRPIRFTGADGQLTNLTATTGAPTVIVNASGQTATLAYDSAGGLVSLTAPGGATTSLIHDPFGRVVQAVSATGLVTSFSYDSADELVSVVSPIGTTATFTYDNAGRLQSLSDPTGTTNFSYDQAGQLVDVIDPLGGFRAFTYLPGGALGTMTDPGGNQTSYLYDQAGDLLRISTATGATTFAYDGVGRVTTETLPTGLVNSYAYGPTGQLVVGTNPSGQATHYSYDSSGRLLSVVDPLGAVTTLGYGVPDGVPPVTSAALTPAQPDGANGWYVHAVHVAVHASDGTGGSGVADTRCELLAAADPGPLSYAAMPDACPYSGAGADAATDGRWMLWAASIDVAGNAETPTAIALRIDATPPVVTCPAMPTFLLGGSGGTVTATVTDATSQPAAGTASAPADVSSAGLRHVTVVGTDNAGNAGSASCPYLVAYRLIGPSVPSSRTTLPAGSAIPVAFALALADGTRIPTSAAQAIVAACDATARLDTSTPSCATYDPTTQLFHVTLKVPKAFPKGTHQVTVDVFVGMTRVDTASVTVKIG